ncbi:MAG TPA: very short patch repair endonuclease [Caulobacteraceae bacterium]|jgi:DNA mismatch endonuclease (patch repair protein)
MTDVFAPEKRSAVMRRVKGRNTGPELKVRKMLWAMGARYRLHRRDLPGAPDIVLPGRRVAVFVHGCFWHGHDCARGARAPKQNAEYWRGKIGRNRERDGSHAAALAARGWTPVTIWECELKDETRLSAMLADILASPPVRGSREGHRRQRPGQGLGGGDSPASQRP